MKVLFVVSRSYQTRLAPVEVPPGVGLRTVVGRVSASYQNGAISGLFVTPVIAVGVKELEAAVKVRLPLVLT